MLEGFLILDRVSHLVDFNPITLFLRFVSLSLEVAQLAGSHCTVLREMLCPYIGYTLIRQMLCPYTGYTVLREMMCPYTGYYTLSSERCCVLTLGTLSSERCCVLTLGILSSERCCVLILGILSSERCCVLTLGIHCPQRDAVSFTLGIHCPQRDAVSLHWVYTVLREMLCPYTGYTLSSKRCCVLYTGYTLSSENKKSTGHTLLRAVSLTISLPRLLCHHLKTI